MKTQNQKTNHQLSFGIVSIILGAISLFLIVIGFTEQFFESAFQYFIPIPGLFLGGLGFINPREKRINAVIGLTVNFIALLPLILLLLFFLLVILSGKSPIFGL
jgi:hypothetical protein